MTLEYHCHISYAYLDKETMHGHDALHEEEGIVSILLLPCLRNFPSFPQRHDHAR